MNFFKEETTYETRLDERKINDSARELAKLFEQCGNREISSETKEKLNFFREFTFSYGIVLFLFCLKSLGCHYCAATAGVEDKMHLLRLVS